jgi:hypothetical protein
MGDSTPPLVNNIGERTSEYWREHGEILPDVLSLPQDALKELVDSIDITMNDLKRELRKHFH